MPISEAASHLSKWSRKALRSFSFFRTWQRAVRWSTRSSGSSSQMALGSEVSSGQKSARSAALRHRPWVTYYTALSPCVVDDQDRKLLPRNSNDYNRICSTCPAPSPDSPLMTVASQPYAQTQASSTLLFPRLPPSLHPHQLEASPRLKASQSTLIPHKKNESNRA